MRYSRIGYGPSLSVYDTRGLEVEVSDSTSEKILTNGVITRRARYIGLVLSDPV
jgi:hypothetical protein